MSWRQSGGAWSQQGAKLVGNGGGTGGNYPYGASSVALSGDGSVALTGVPSTSGIGEASLFTRSGATWTLRTTVSDPGGLGRFGISVALSNDGSTAIVGDPSSPEANEWIYERSGGTLTLQSQFLVSGDQVRSVALASNNSSLVVGNPSDSSNTGAVWVFVPYDAAATHDFNGDSISDILWRDSSGDAVIWLMNGGQILQSGSLGSVPLVWSAVGQRDFVGSGKAAILWRDTIGDLVIWFMNGPQVSSSSSLGSVPTNWEVAGTGDLNGDSVGDILWHDNNSGNVAVWFMNGARVASTAGFGSMGTNWTIVGDDNKGDIFWHDTSGNYAAWHVKGSQVTQMAALGNVPLATWQIAGFGDFNGDGNTDILWRDTSGNTAIWFLDSAFGIQSEVSLGNTPTNWSVAQTGDYNNDGMSDILWQDSSGDLALWFMNGGTVSSTAGLGNVGTSWTVQSVNAE